MSDYVPLKLLAADAEDVQVLAAVMQDAIVPVCDMRYFAGDSSFIMVVHRFLWDCGDDGAREGERDGDCFRRVRCAVDMRGVMGAGFRGFEPGDEERMLELLTMGVEGGHIHFVFAGGAGLKLEAGQDWKVTVRDFGEPWPVSRKPEHRD